MKILVRSHNDPLALKRAVTPYLEKGDPVRVYDWSLVAVSNENKVMLRSMAREYRTSIDYASVREWEIFGKELRKYEDIDLDVFAGESNFLNRAVLDNRGEIARVIQGATGLPLERKNDILCFRNPGGSVSTQRTREVEQKESYVGKLSTELNFKWVKPPRGKVKVVIYGQDPWGWDYSYVERPSFLRKPSSCMDLDMTGTVPPYLGPGYIESWGGPGSSNLLLCSSAVVTGTELDVNDDENSISPEMWNKAMKAAKLVLENGVRMAVPL